MTDPRPGRCEDRNGRALAERGHPGRARNIRVRVIRYLALATLLLAGACEEQKMLEAEPEVRPSQTPYTVALDYRDPAILTLREGEELEVDFESSGCFHSFRYRFRIKGGESPEADIYEAAGNNDTELFLGTVELTQLEARRLDTAITFYRTDPPGGCTTYETFTLTWSKDGAHTTEQLSDGSCGRYELDPPMMTFYELASRVK